MVDYAKSLPPHETEETPYSIQHLANDLISHCNANLTANSVVIPVLKTFSVLLEGDAFEIIQDDTTANQWYFAP